MHPTMQKCHRKLVIRLVQIFKGLIKFQFYKAGQNCFYKNANIYITMEISDIHTLVGHHDHGRQCLRYTTRI